MDEAIDFLDESGDESGKLARGASRLFVVGLVVFPDPAEAARCHERLDALRAELGKPERYEFHFRKNSDAIRRALLAEARAFAFTYHAVVLDNAASTSSERVPLYLEAVSQLCNLAGDSLTNALLIVDAGEPNKRQRRAAASEIRQQVNRKAGRRALAEVRAQESSRNTLNQLADYATGVASWWAQDKPGGAAYRRLLHAGEGKYLRIEV